MDEEIPRKQGKPRIDGRGNEWEMRGAQEQIETAPGTGVRQALEMMEDTEPPMNSSKKVDRMLELSKTTGAGTGNGIETIDKLRRVRTGKLSE